MAKNLREKMPTVAAWIDDMRAAFGADSINTAMRDGLLPGAQTPHRFFASEGGVELGQPNDMSRARQATVVDLGGSFPDSTDCERKAREKKLVTGGGRSDRRGRSGTGRRSA